MPRGSRKDVENIGFFQMIYSKDKIWDHVDSIDFLKAGKLKKKKRFDRLTFAQLSSEFILEYFIFFFTLFEFEICESLEARMVGFWYIKLGTGYTLH